MEVIKKIVGTILLIVLYLSAFSQKSDFYYDFNVDYFPKIVAVKFDTSQSIQFSTMVQGEFIETLNLVTKKNFGKGKYTERMSGLTMLSSGICPHQLKEAESWIKLDIDKSGKIDNLEFYQNVVEYNETISKNFRDILETAKINPALKSLEPVNVRLFFTIKSKEK